MGRFLTLPEDLHHIQIRATEESTYDYTLAVWLVDHPVKDGSFLENAIPAIYYATGGGILILIGVFIWRRFKKGSNANANTL